MKRLMTLLAAIALMSASLWADETVTVSANSSDISQALDLKVVANLFAESKNLEEFESKLNDPSEFYNNLDLNGDGDVDYIRVVEVGEGTQRMVILQAILAKDIYQDIATIYVEKDASEQVSIQIIGDEYVYGTNYIIEPVYIYRPVIYDWFWSPAWYAWTSPWYWGYYPSWWYFHSCIAWDVYWHHCYAYHHHHHYCSYRYGCEPRRGYREMYGRHSRVSRREYAQRHPERSFASRNTGVSNARALQTGSSTRTSARQVDARSAGGSARTASGSSTRTASGSSTRSSIHGDRTFGSRTTATTGRSAATTSRSSATTGRSSATTTRSAGSTATTGRSSATTTRSSSTTTRSSSTTTRSTGLYRTPSTSSSSRSSSTTTRSAGTTTRSSGSTYSGSTRSSGSTYSGGSRSSGGSFSGGGGRSSGGSSGGSRRR